MAKRDRTIEKLDELAALKSVTDASAVRPALAAAIDDKVNLVVEKAAQLAVKFELADLGPALAAVFGRFMVNPVKTDPSCAAKTGIVQALAHFNADAREIYLIGLKHVQPEPVWGGERDTAAKLRGLSALGLTALGYKDILYELADLIFDPDPEARLLGCRALGGTGSDSAALLLRAKASAGHENADVLAECFAGLLSLQPNRSVEFIARFLASANGQTVEAAAMAIGASRNPRAFELLRDAYEGDRIPRDTDPFPLAIAMTRQPAAVEYLLAELESGSTDAAGALRLFRNDPAVAQRVQAILDAANDPRLHRRWRSG